MPAVSLLHRTEYSRPSRISLSCFPLYIRQRLAQTDTRGSTNAANGTEDGFRTTNLNPATSHRLRYAPQTTRNSEADREGPGQDVDTDSQVDESDALPFSSLAAGVEGSSGEEKDRLAFDRLPSHVSSVTEPRGLPAAERATEAVDDADGRSSGARGVAEEKDEVEGLTYMTGDSRGVDAGGVLSASDEAFVLSGTFWLL